MTNFVSRLPMCIALAAVALCAAVNPAGAIQPTLEKITQEADGRVTYHFKIKVDETVRVESQGKEPNPDFFTIFNFTRGKASVARLYRQLIIHYGPVALRENREIQIFPVA